MFRKRSVFILVQKKGDAKECSNYCTIALISQASKVMFKILQARLQQCVNQELPEMYKRDYEKAEETEIKLPTFFGTWIKQENSRKTSTSASFTMLKPLTRGITTNCEKFLNKWEYQSTFPISWQTCRQVKRQQLEPDMEKLTSSKFEKEYDKDIYFHPAYLTCMQSPSCERPSWMNHKLKLRLSGEISTTSEMQMITTLMA